MSLLARPGHRPTNRDQEGETRRENGTEAGGGFKLDPVRTEAKETPKGSAGQTDNNNTKKNKKKMKVKVKGPSERDLNPYRSVSRVRCGGTMEDGVTPCNKKVR